MYVIIYNFSLSWYTVYLLAFTLMSADVMIYETAEHQRLENMCQRCGLSLTIPLELWDLVSADG